MGVAAYNRGSVCIAQQAKIEVRPVEFEMMDRLNSVVKVPGAQTPFGPTRIAQGNGGFWLYCPVKGYGYWYKTLVEIMRSWNISITGFDGEWIATPN